MSWSPFPSPRIPEVRLDSGLVPPSQLPSHWPFPWAAEMCVKPSRCPRLPPYLFPFTSPPFPWSAGMCLLISGHITMHIWHPECYLCVVALFQHFWPIFCWPSWVKTVHQKMKSGQRDRFCDESGDRLMPLRLGKAAVGHTQKCQQPGVEYVKHSLLYSLEKNTRSWYVPLLAWAKIDGYPGNKLSSIYSKKN